MKFKKLFALAATAAILGSCAAPKTISYFQDIVPGESELTISAPEEIRIKPKDKISILVNSQDPRLTNMFNLPILANQIGTESSSAQSRGLSGYTVSNSGCIDFPVLGEIRVEGLTREEVASSIKDKLRSQDLVKDPVVTVEFMNLSISILGEVKNPGRYNIDRDRLTVIDAVSMAGDMTIFGKRENVLVLRHEQGKQQAYKVNLNSGEELLSSPAYYLQQGDVVYVEPNNTRKRQSTVNGNTVLSTSFWISVASLLTSIVTTVAVFVK